MEMINLSLDLTPEEANKATQFFANQGKTLEEGVKSLLYVVLRNNDRNNGIELPKMVKPKHSPIRMLNNDGTFAYPADAPKEIMDIVRELEEMEDLE